MNESNNGMDEGGVAPDARQLLLELHHCSVRRKKHTHFMGELSSPQSIAICN